MADLSASSPVPFGEAAVARSGAEFGYPAPDDDRQLREVIAGRYDSATADDIVVASGASGALAAVALAIVRPGDRVVVERSAYPTFPSLAGAFGATIAPCFEAGLACRAAISSNPSVPCGQLADLAAWLADAAAVGAVPVVDEVYRELAFAHRPAAAVDLDERAVSIGDLSKPLGLGGLRIGWVATRDRDLAAKIRRNVQLLSGGPCSLSITAGQSAFRQFDRSLGMVLSAARRSAQETYGVLRAFGWRFVEARAGLTVLAVPPRQVDADELHSLRRSGFFLLPSDVFGVPGGFRVTLLFPRQLEAALALLASGPAQRPACGAGSTPTLVVLTKAPIVGLAKTRLAAEIGEAESADVAVAMVADTLALAESGPWQTTVAFAPPNGEPMLRRLTQGARFVAQCDGDLGARIVQALRDEVTRGNRPVLIGSDTPDLPRAVVAEAFRALEGADIVLGPARDGGFYLIGATRLEDALFDSVDWSTCTVFERTRANAERLGLEVAVLREWEDVDDLASLCALRERLAGSEACPATRAVLSALKLEPPHVC